MKRTAALVTILLLAVISWDCKENPAEAELSIEEKINAAEPITYVSVFHGDSYSAYYSNGGTLQDAYAKSGYLVVIAFSTHYFNLMTAKDIEVRDHNIYIRY